jgi:hypothetical protein
MTRSPFDTTNGAIVKIDVKDGARDDDEPLVQMWTAEEGVLMSRIMLSTHAQVSF